MVLRPSAKRFYIFREGIVELDAAVDNLTVVNLATFETRIVHLDLAGLSLQLELFIPLLRVSVLDQIFVILYPKQTPFLPL